MITKAALQEMIEKNANQIYRHPKSCSCQGNSIEIPKILTYTAGAESMLEIAMIAIEALQNAGPPGHAIECTNSVPENGPYYCQFCEIHESLTKIEKLVKETK